MIIIKLFIGAVLSPSTITKETSISGVVLKDVGLEYNLSYESESVPVIAKEYLRQGLIDRGVYGYDLDTYIRIARGESQFVVNAIGYAEIPRCGRAMGVFQILPCTWHGLGCKGDYFDLDAQMDCALKVKKAQGWEAWEVY